MSRTLPDLSRFELQCLRLLWDQGEASARQIHERIDEPPSYSTVRKIFERLEDKGAIERVGKAGRAFVYRPTVGRTAMMRKEIQRLLDALFDGAAAPLLSHLAQMRELSLDDLREIEREIGVDERGSGENGR